MPFTLKEKLEQLRDTPAGGSTPAFFKNSFSYVDDLRELAKEALAKIEELEEKAWKYDELCK